MWPGPGGGEGGKVETRDGSGNSSMPAHLYLCCVGHKKATGVWSRRVWIWSIVHGVLVQDCSLWNCRAGVAAAPAFRRRNKQLARGVAAPGRTYSVAVCIKQPPSLSVQRYVSYSRCHVSFRKGVLRFVQLLQDWPCCSYSGFAVAGGDSSSCTT